MTEELEQLLKNLKLRRILEIYDEQLRAADKDDISYSEFVTRLVRAQFQARQEGALEWRIQRAKLPERWTLETFPFTAGSGLPCCLAMVILGRLLFTSCPCKGYSGLLPEEKSRSVKYQALNRLALRAVWLMLEDSGTTDLITNTVGTYLGILLYRRLISSVRRWRQGFLGCPFCCRPDREAVRGRLGPGSVRRTAARQIVRESLWAMWWPSQSRAAFGRQKEGARSG